MSSQMVIFFLPYFVSILVKLWSVFADRRLMLSVLDSLSALPKPPEVQFSLDSNQQRVIAAHLIQTNVKSTMVVTFFSSFIAAFVTLFEAPTVHWIAVSLPVILVVGLVTLAWIIPSRAPELAAKGWLGIEKGTWGLLSSCVYDVVLAALAYEELRRATFSSAHT